MVLIIIKVHLSQKIMKDKVRIIVSEQEQNESQKGRSALDTFMEQKSKGNILIILEICN